MVRLISVLAVCAAILMGTGLGVELTHSRAADAKEPAAIKNDPEGAVRAFVSALNSGDLAAAGALLDDDVTFFEPNGVDSFGAVGKVAFESILSVLPETGFHATIQTARVHGDTVSGVVATADDDSKAAGVKRYLELFTISVVNGKLVSFDFLFDTNDAQTSTYLAHGRSQPEEDGGDEGPPPGQIDVTLGPGAGGSQPGTAFLTDAWGLGGVSDVTVVGVQIQPGPAGAQQTAELVSGSCAAPGETVYRLAAVVDGASFTIISASADELLAQGLSLQVHQVNQTDRVNACGAVLAAAVAPPPAPPATTIKPPATGMGLAADGGLSLWLLAAVAAIGVFAVATGARLRRAGAR